MPEYLSPGPYVEEVDTGSKPIENASTSTAGMLGLTDRGPPNVPILVTNTGDYAQMFGGLLDRGVFGDRGHLPLAVDGFFRNGGRRLYVTRILSASAAPSAMLLYNRGELGGGIAPNTALLIAAHPTENNITVMEAAGIGGTDPIRIGGGSGAEWHDVSAVAAAVQNVVLDLPLSNPSATAVPVANCVQAFAVSGAPAPLGGPHTILESAPAGSQTLMLHTTADLTTITPATQVLELRRNGPRELIGVRTVTALGGDDYRIALTNPLALAHPAGGTVNVLALGAMTAHDALQPVSSGDVCIVYNGAALGAGEIVEVVSASGAHEFRRQTQPGRITLARPLSFDLPHLAPVEHLVPVDASVTQLSADAAANARTITVLDRTNFTIGGILRLGGVAADTEFVTIAALPGTTPTGVPTGPGAVILAHGLAQAHLASEQVAAQNSNIESAAGGSVILGGVARGETSVLATDIAGYTVAPGALRTVDNNGVVRVVVITATAATAAQTLTLATPLTAEHGPGATVGERRALLEVQALDAGSWGDRLRISIQDENSGLVTQAFGTGMIGANRMIVSSLSGLETGSVLALYDSTGQLIEPLLKVDQVDSNLKSVTIAGGLAAPQIAALGAPGAKIMLRSREFRLMVTLLQRPPPAQPWRADTVEDTEVFRQLSMDPRHSRYVEKIIGQIGGPLRLSDRRPEGESLYIRVRDTTAAPAPGSTDDRWATRLGPEALVDIQPSGLRRPARHPLTGGDDGLTMLSDADYLGADDRDPVKRRGIPAMKSIDEISIVAVPGIVSQLVQETLIDHCEEMRYRFAVLDGPAPPNDDIADVQALRQNFDTRHAAVYHPWLTIPDPMPGNLATIAQTPIPPSGHMLGIYARTDIERGVHKAPANEVVRGITGLRHYLNKSEQDILNPYPSNINVIRDFRLDSRAIRVWGARVITSDPDYKYVPVRRLLLFIEKSIERNMNWVVFEPNAEPLWSRVHLSITSFLTTIWRSGALEGTTTDQAFTVSCDRSTMTQADIDNGRLICKVGVAAVKPAEFVIIRIGLKAATSEE
jgi:phage tail sheath protein FI